ncbi:MAG TPA: bifunctional hydroxymethylpyrimidine kinase/phosphomethylpyrimidine kinase [Aquifex aeolicus]|nr:bifunctional hydroxymethylpyrimidine kinase/phosphomethylpyrimidine kinase [Aquifex aeolicus]
MKIPRALTIAGSDPSGGAGVQADVKTFTALGVYGMGAITSLTVQDTVGVRRVFTLPPDFIYEQVKTVLEDIGADALKTGMLGNEGVARAVVEAVRESGMRNLVVDPVLASTEGRSLFEGDIASLKRELFPLAELITPNLIEAGLLCGMEIKRVRDMEECAKKLLAFGPRAVLIKGGHLRGGKAIDLLYEGGEEFHYFVRDKVETKNTHGTGCTLSAAITAYLAKGESLKGAVEKAKDYTHGAIEKSLELGRGRGPLNHLWRLRLR